ncbi:hypothetical protein AYI70_g644 [Smittium culicis]|uniref:Uncharacterized protein n=1 Tax=Smittium culicis TaxID=133412 RepID=A0A1R1YFW4_9FUNG|nr:hypothetical protein AYI70_g644 [Smittium culicis]
MKLFQSNIAAMVTKKRSDKLPGKPQNIIVSEIKLLIDNIKLETLVTRNPEAKKTKNGFAFEGEKIHLIKITAVTILFRKNRQDFSTDLFL